MAKKEVLPNGFSYSFSIKIYTKLEKLKAEDKVFLKGVAEVKDEDNKYAHEILPLAKCFILHLAEQVKIDQPEENFTEFNSFMELVHEFLETVAPD